MYQDLSEEDKRKKRYNLPKDEKQRLVEYRKKKYRKNKTSSPIVKDWLFWLVTYARFFSNKYIKPFFKDLCFQ